MAARIRRALRTSRRSGSLIAPDCGLKYLPRDVAFAKLEAMVTPPAPPRRQEGWGG